MSRYLVGTRSEASQTPCNVDDVRTRARSNTYRLRPPGFARGLTHSPLPRPPPNPVRWLTKLTSGRWSVGP